MENNKYKDIMSHVNVDDEMRERILKNIANANLDTVTPITPKKKFNITRITPLIAVAVALVIGGVVLFKSVDSSNSKKVTTHNEAITNNAQSGIKNESATQETVAAVEEVDGLRGEDFEAPAVDSEECDDNIAIEGAPEIQGTTVEVEVNSGASAPSTIVWPEEDMLFTAKYDLSDAYYELSDNATPITDLEALVVLCLRTDGTFVRSFDVTDVLIDFEQYSDYISYYQNNVIEGTWTIQNESVLLDIDDIELKIVGDYEGLILQSGDLELVFWRVMECN